MKLSFDEFWNLTPRELNLKIKYFEREKEDKDKEILTLAWYSAYFGRVKKLEKLETVLKNIKRQKPAKQNRIKDDTELKEIAKNKGITLPPK